MSITLYVTDIILIYMIIVYMNYIKEHYVVGLIYADVHNLYLTVEDL